MKNKNLKLSGMIVAGIIVLVSFAYAVEIQPIAFGRVTDNDYEITTFGSYQELTEFLRSRSSYSYYGYENRFLEFDTIPMADWSNFDVALKSEGGTVVDYSQTNVQVTGVDEPDLIKTDGTYLYIISNNKVIIVLAVPAEDAKIICKIEVNSTLTIKNIFINGDRLVIFSEGYNYPIIDEPVIGLDKLELQTSKVYCQIRWYSSPETHMDIYSLEDIENPKLAKDVVVPGRLSGARMIGDFVYVITSQYSYDICKVAYDEEIIPTIWVDGTAKKVDLSDIKCIMPYYDDTSITNVVSVNVKDVSEDVNAEMFLLGHSNIMYVSSNNIYLTQSVTTYDYELLKEIVDEVVLKYLSHDQMLQLAFVDTLSVEDYQKKSLTEWILDSFTSNMESEKLENLSREIMFKLDRTVIHRISISDGKIEYAARGEVPGGAKNQFSLNEHNGYLRISTTTQSWSITSFMTSIPSMNNVYVLNMDLEIVGKVECLAPTEQIYATRFLGDKCYLVTFRQVDPFYVIDLSDPTNPTVLGELKIPGFSTYIHPYDETHVIGIGRDGGKVKVSLFDVTDVSNPIELSKYEVTCEDEGWWWNVESIALDEHKAFLFDKEKNLLVIPIGSYYKQDAYVFKVSIKDGVKLQDKIEHEVAFPEESECLYYYDDGCSVKRALYIEDVLYTISDSMVKMNNLDDLSEINSILLV